MADADFDVSQKARKTQKDRGKLIISQKAQKDRGKLIISQNSQKTQKDRGKLIISQKARKTQILLSTFNFQLL